MANKLCISLKINGWQAVAGLDWHVELVRQRRALRAQARTRGHALFVVVPEKDDGVDGALTGSGSPATEGSGLQVSLAQLVLPGLGPATAAIFPLDNLYWFIATEPDGRLSLFSDIVGTRDLVTEAFRLYEERTPLSEAGRRCLAPVGFLEQASEVPELAALLPTAPPVWTRYLPGRLDALRLSPVSTRSRTTQVIAMTVIVLAGWLFWHHHETQLQQQQLDAWRKSRVRHHRPTTEPWKTEPSLRDFLQQCSRARHHLHLSIAGWAFMDTLCGVDKDSNAPVLLSFYGRPPDGTVNDFFYRLQDFYPGLRAQFDIPGPGKTAHFAIPMKPVPDARDDVLPTADFAIRQMTSYAQVLHATVIIKPDDSRLAAQLPWQTLDFTFRTDFPPEILFHPAHFNASGVRLEAIEVARNNSWLHFTLKGKMYAKKD